MVAILNAMVEVYITAGWDFLLAYPASRHPSIRIIYKGEAASGRPPFVEAAEGCLPGGWVSGGWAGKEGIQPW